MSYTILYRSLFIRLSDGTYIPMVESGDNNVWESDLRRRARSWSSCRWFHEGDEQRFRYSLSENEILAGVQKEIDDVLQRNVGKEPAFGGNPYTEEDVLGNLGFFNATYIYGSRTMSASKFMNFFKAGIRNAIAMEELRAGLRLSWYEDSDDGKNSRFCTDYAKDETDLAEKWATYRSKGITPWIGLSGSAAEYGWQLIKNRNRKPKAERKTQTEYYVIAFKYGDAKKYAVKLTPKNLRYNPWIEYAHKYTSLRVAENAIKSMERRFDQISDVHVERISA